MIPCRVCNISLCGMEQYVAHVKGQDHRKRERGESGQQYHCSLCDVQLSGDQARVSHEMGKMHQANLLKVNNRQLIAGPHNPPPAPSPLPALVSGYTPYQLAPLPQRPIDLTTPSFPTPPEVLPATSERKREREDRPADGGSSNSSNSKRNHVASRLRDVAAAIERGDHSDAPLVTLKIVAQRGSRAAKSVPRFKMTIDELYNGEENDHDDAGSSRASSSSDSYRSNDRDRYRSEARVRQ